MRATLYRRLMQQLDNAVANGYEEEMAEMEPAAILDELIEETGIREYAEVDREEMLRAIQNWQERL